MLVGLGLASWVFFTNPGRSQNRLLALVITFQAIIVGFAQGVMFFFDDPASVYALQGVAFTFFWPYVLAYLAFLGTLDTRATRWLRLGWVRWSLLGLAAVGFVAYVSRFDLFVTGTAPAPYARLDAEFTQLAILHQVFVPLPLFLFGIYAALSNLRSTKPGTPARSRAKAYFGAFLFNDLQNLILTLAFVVALYAPEHIYESINAYIVVSYFVVLLFFVLLAYGLLKTQLFDIDLKVKWTIRRGSLAAFFLAAFFVASQLAQAVLPGVLGGPIVGAVVVGLLMFAVRPLERAAGKFADTAMPTVKDNEDYRTVRKKDVYRAAVESALRDGSVSEKERGMLAALADQLGLAAGEAHGIEIDARRTMA